MAGTSGRRADGRRATPAPRGSGARGGEGDAVTRYRDHAGVAEWTDRLLDAAADRPAFGADAVRRLQAEHRDGPCNHATAPTSLTGVEPWLQRFVDGR